jgi:magnesium-transporting ATPase (P-type)
MKSDSTVEPQPPRKRPILVWVIFLFYLISCVQVIVGLFFVTAGGVDMAPAQQAYLAKFTIMDRVIGYVNAGLTLIGVTLLFTLRKQAVNVLALAFALNMFSTAVVWFKTDPASVVSPAGLVAQALGIALFGAVVFYAWRLGKRGMLVK